MKFLIKRKMLKLVIVDHDPRFTGSTYSMLYLIDELSSKFDLILLSNKNKDDLDKISDKYGIKCITMSNFYNLNLHFDNDYKLYTLLGIYSIILSLRRFLTGYYYAKKIFLQLKPDVVYLNEYVLLQFVIAAKKMKIKTATHVRSQVINGVFGLRKKIISKLITKYCDYIFPISKTDKNQFKNFENKFYIIREFLNEENYITADKFQLRKNLSIPLNKIVVLFIGGIYTIKGSLIFLKAAQEIIKNNTNIIFILAGPQINNTIPNKKYFEESIHYFESHSWNNQFIFINKPINSKDYISLSDILVSANTVSHFSRPIIEAWALKKGVICSDTTHNLEIIENQKDALLYSKDNPYDLAEKVTLLTKYPDLLEKIGENGFLKSIDLFSQQKNIKKITSIFHSINNFSL